MGNSNKKQNQVTDETQFQTAENSQTETPVLTDSGNNDTLPPVTPSDESAGSTIDGDKEPKAGSGKSQENGGDTSSADKKDEKDGTATLKKVKLTLRHKSHTTNYHRCGLTLTKVFAEYEVPSDCVEKIKSDRWIEVKDGK